MQGRPALRILVDAAKRRRVHPVLDNGINLLKHLYVGQRWLYSRAIAYLNLTRLNSSLQIFILVFKDEQGALLKVLNQILEDLELAEVGALMNERIATIVRAKNELMYLNMVESSEYIDESVNVAALDC